MARPSIPSSTYRVQMLGHLDFDAVRGLVDYFHDLGIGALYLSPFSRARNKSTHGYDIVDHSRYDPSLGSEEGFGLLAEALGDRGMGLVADVVPNHMSIDDPHNVWWQDVLQNGQGSPYANYFDIDWTPPKTELHGKVLLAVLGDQFGKVLEDQQIHLVYEDQRFAIRYYDKHFPTGPRSWVSVLRLALEQVPPVLAADHPQRMELESVISALEHIPPRSAPTPEVIQERHREKEVARRRLASLLQSSGEIREALAGALEQFNGARGDPASFDRLEAFLNEQAYRLCYWRVATDEINYRRFFDVDTLAAIRVEDPVVFDAVHQNLLAAMAAGQITGLRIDHADGLLDPRQYLEKIAEQAAAAAGKAREDRPTDGGVGPASVAGGGSAESDRQTARPPSARAAHDASVPYLVVEKILTGDESLPADWPVHGTTGYNFLNQLNGLFVSGPGFVRLCDIYRRFTGQAEPFWRVVYDAKQLILATSLSSELYGLANQLDQIAEQHRWSRDFTRPSLYRALREVVSCFTAYRTYIRPGSDVVSDDDRRRIRAAVRLARRRNPAMSPTFFEFIASVLLLEDPEGISEADREFRRRFVFKFQQITGPITAKGLEDTAFYRYYPLASLAEVGGGDPSQAAMSPERLHRALAARRQDWPFEMSATATHDTKRGEDLRARLNVLSETPEAWEAAVGRWRAMNADARQMIDDEAAPDANEEYLFYQTLIGLWPVAPVNDADWELLGQRVVQYMEKALREAKLHTSWLHPDGEYEEAVFSFVRQAMADRASPFLEDVDRFVRSIASAGFVNSLAQTAIKLFAPGVPDFYQGVEFWDFSLVDPDNRRPVDFQKRRRALGGLMAGSRQSLAGLAADLLRSWPDERIKMFVLWRGLQWRRAHAELAGADYRPLVVSGPREANTFAFARAAGRRWVMVVTPRLSLEAQRVEPEVPPRNAGSGGTNAGRTTMGQTNTGHWRPAAWWANTRVEAPPDAPRRWTHLFTGQQVALAPSGESAGAAPVDALLRPFPVAVLIGEPESANQTNPPVLDNERRP